MPYCASECPDRREFKCRLDPGNHELHWGGQDRDLQDVWWENCEFQPRIQPDNMTRPEFNDKALGIKGRAERPVRLGPLDASRAWLRNGAYDTERHAARATEITGAPRRKAVLRVFAEAGKDGATDDEVSARLADPVVFPSNKVATRRKELCEMGWLEESGMERTTRQGNPAIVWVLTEDAKQEIGPWLFETRESRSPVPTGANPVTVGLRHFD
jgi:hypothetical protein